MLIHANRHPVKPVRTVIIGAKGFVALHLNRLLQDDQFDCRPVGCGEIDLLQSTAVDGLRKILAPQDAVVITAALTPDKGRDVSTLMKNLRMVESLCAAFAQVKCSHVIYISSDAIYDGRVPLINEDSVGEPPDLYGLMHIAREKMLANASQAAGIPLAILRPCAVYGMGDTHNSYGPNRFIRTAVANGKITLFGNGEEQRDHVFIDDLTRITRLCLVHRSAGILNVVSGRSSSFMSVALHVRTHMQRDIEIVCLPRNGEITHRHFETTGLIKSFPGFQPTAIEDGLRSTIAGTIDSAHKAGAA